MRVSADFCRWNVLKGLRGWSARNKDHQPMAEHIKAVSSVPVKRVEVLHCLELAAETCHESMFQR